MLGMTIEPRAWLGRLVGISGGICRVAQVAHPDRPVAGRHHSDKHSCRRSVAGISGLPRERLHEFFPVGCAVYSGTVVQSGGSGDRITRGADRDLLTACSGLHMADDTVTGTGRHLEKEMIDD